VYSLADIYGEADGVVPEVSRAAAELRAMQKSTALVGGEMHEFGGHGTYLGEETGTFTWDMEF